MLLIIIFFSNFLNIIITKFIQILGRNCDKRQETIIFHKNRTNLFYSILLGSLVKIKYICENLFIL